MVSLYLNFESVGKMLMITGEMRKAVQKKSLKRKKLSLKGDLVQLKRTKERQQE